MELDDPVFREIIIPWYDSDGVCVSLITFMGIVFVFGLFGIAAAIEKVEYQQYLWVPVGVSMMSAYVGISIALRLFQRNTRRRKKRRRD
jgi:hypothetical protein